MRLNEVASQHAIARVRRVVTAVPDTEAPGSLQSRAAEQHVLGALLIEPSCWEQIAGLLLERDFAGADHRLIFGAIAGFARGGRPLDASSIAEHLQRAGRLDEAGGAAYLQKLAHDTATSATAGLWARAVHERSLLRDLAREANRIERSVREGSPEDVAKLIGEAESSLARLRERADSSALALRAPMDWAALGERAPPVRTWRISYWLTAGPTLFAGSGGVGKTMIAQTIATALALGRRFIDDVHEPTTVLMWACEDEHDELWRRQAAICRYFDVPLSSLKGRLIIEPRLGRENTLFSVAYGAPAWTGLRKELAAQVQDYGAGVLFLDNIGQLYGGKENDRHHVTAFLNGLMGLTEDKSFAPVILGHPSKAADSEFSGSTAWENGVRTRWYMGYRLPDQKADGTEEETEDANVRYLAKRKANYSEKDYRKFVLKDGIFVPERDEPGEFSRRYGGTARHEAAEQCVLHALARIAEAGIRVTDGRTSPDYLPRKMREMKLAADYTPKELGQALAQLRLAGRIKEGVVGQYENRTVKRGLVLP